MPGALDRLRELPLVRGTHTTDPAGENLPALRNEMPKELSILEVDVGDLLRAEFANSLVSYRKSFRAWHSFNLS